MSFFEDFKLKVARSVPEYLAAWQSQAPAMGESEATDLLSPLLVSPALISISRTQFDHVQKLIETFYTIRSAPLYQNLVRASVEAELRETDAAALGEPVVSRGKSSLGDALKFLERDPGHASVLMSYDFHLTPEGFKLIEINTNAAGLLLSDALNRYHEIEIPRPEFASLEDDLKASFESEWNLFSARTTGSIQRIAIIDEKPLEQKTYFEFLMFAHYFRQWGWDVVIGDPSAFTFRDGDEKLQSSRGPVDFVYNRYCDFLLDAPESAHLKRAYLNSKTCFSPHPREYLLLADKERLADLTGLTASAGALESMGLSKDQIHSIRETLPSFDKVTFQNAEQLWQNRKALFFKPKRSFGGKAAYRGSSVSRKVFDEIVHGNYVAQGFVEAPKTLVSVDGTDEEFKYDIRFYAYQNRIQGIVARLFRGQLTNFRTPGGGFAAVAVRG